MPALTWAGIISSIVYGLLGLILLLIGYSVYELITPWSVKEEPTTQSRGGHGCRGVYPRHGRRHRGRYS